jgi:hypothetical protein
MAWRFFFEFVINPPGHLYSDTYVAKGVVESRNTVKLIIMSGVWTRTIGVTPIAEVEMVG